MFYATLSFFTTSSQIDFESEEGEGPPPHIQCNGPNANRPCPDAMPSPYTCDDGAEMCCRWTNIPSSKTRKQVREFERTVNIPGFGTCTRDTTESDDIDSFNSVDSSEDDEAEEFAGFLRGISLEGNKCECNNNKDCANNEKCHSSSCSKHNGWKAGICKKSGGNNKNPNRACNYKQCTHKSNGSCECRSDERCVKGSQYKNYCNQSGDKNGCCVYDALLDGQEVE